MTFKLKIKIYKFSIYEKYAAVQMCPLLKGRSQLSGRLIPNILDVK
jgi:hypothetical protein